MNIPFLSNIADWYSYVATIAILTGNATGRAVITTSQDCYFAMMAWRLYTTEDDPSLLFNNNCALTVSRGSSYQMMSGPIPQSLIGSSSYFAGKQWEWPIIYSPLTNFDIEAIDLSGSANTIYLAMEGYHIPVARWPTFIRYFPALEAIYSETSAPQI